MHSKDYKVSLYHNAENTEKTVLTIKSKNAHAAAKQFLNKMDPTAQLFSGKYEQPKTNEHGEIVNCMSFGNSFGQRVYVWWIE